MSFSLRPAAIVFFLALAGVLLGLAAVHAFAPSHSHGVVLGAKQATLHVQSTGLRWNGLRWNGLRWN